MARVISGGAVVCVAISVLSLLNSALAVTTGFNYGIAAWSTDIGEQVMIANYSTNQIQYSYCNSFGSPVYPVDSPNVLPLQRPINDHASIVGAGWWTEQTNNTYASIFYQDNNWAISNAFLTCNMSTGQWVITGNWPISIGTPSVNRQTGLALLQLGSVLGYRLYYHDANMAIQVLDYNPNTTEWYYGGTVSGDSQPTLNLAAEFHDEGGSASNITVLSVKDASNLEESRFNKDNSYHISTFPQPLTSNYTWKTAVNSTVGPLSVNTTSKANFTLDSFDSSQVTLAMTVDLTNNRSFWYIGKDNSLRQYSSVNSSLWSAQPAQPASIWPKADNPSAPLAACYNTNQYWNRIYYMVNEHLMEVRYDNFSATNGTWMWAPAKPVGTYLPEVLNSTTGSGGSSGSGLSTGAQAGIGVGVAVGVLGLVAAGAIFFFHRRRQQRDARATEVAANGEDGYGTTKKGAVEAAAPIDSLRGTPRSGASAGPWKPTDDYEINSVSTTPNTSPRAEFVAAAQQAAAGGRAAPVRGKREMETVERPQELAGTHAHEIDTQGEEVERKAELEGKK